MPRCSEPRCPGWFVNAETRCVEMCDECRVFAHDDEAVEHVNGLRELEWHITRHLPYPNAGKSFYLAMRLLDDDNEYCDSCLLLDQDDEFLGLCIGLYQEGRLMGTMTSSCRGYVVDKSVFAQSILDRVHVALLPLMIHESQTVTVSLRGNKFTFELPGHRARHSIKSIAACLAEQGE